MAGDRQPVKPWTVEGHPFVEVQPYGGRCTGKQLESRQSSQRASRATKVCEQRVPRTPFGRYDELLVCHSTAAVVPGHIDLISLRCRGRKCKLEGDHFSLAKPAGLCETVQMQIDRRRISGPLGSRGGGLPRIRQQRKQQETEHRKTSAE